MAGNAKRRLQQIETPTSASPFANTRYRTSRKDASIHIHHKPGATPNGGHAAPKKPKVFLLLFLQKKKNPGFFSAKTSQSPQK
jgi:hypothetical protein